jgi:hypothetical protein
VVGKKNIQAAEYFVDYDPGEGNATPLEIKMAKLMFPILIRPIYLLE